MSGLLDDFFEDTQDVLTSEAIRKVAVAIECGELGELQTWLRDVALCDGTPNEARLAAILLALLKRDAEP